MKLLSDIWHCVQSLKMSVSKINLYRDVASSLHFLYTLDTLNVAGIKKFSMMKCLISNVVKNCVPDDVDIVHVVKVSCGIQCQSKNVIPPEVF